MTTPLLSRREFGYALLATASTAGGCSSVVQPESRVEWSVSLSGGVPVRSTPAVHGRYLFTGTQDGALYAIDRVERELDWSRPVGELLYGSPSVAGSRVYVVSDRATCVRETGESVWTTPLPDDDFVGSARPPVVSDGAVYFGTGRGFAVALDADTGEVEWRTDVSIGSVEWWSATDDLLVLGTEEGVVSARSLADGSEHWQRTVGGRARPTVDGSVVYVGCRGRDDEPDLLAFDAGTGSRKWSVRSNAAGYAAPTVDDGVLYVAGGWHRDEPGHLHAVATADGERQWARSMDHGVPSRPVMTDDGVVVGTLHGRVEAVNAAGESRWRQAVDGGVLVAPAVGDETAYVGTSEGSIHGIRR